MKTKEVIGRNNIFKTKMNKKDCIIYGMEKIVVLELQKKILEEKHICNNKEQNTDLYNTE